MKVLYLTNGFPPHRWAGTETYTAGIAKGIHRKGHTVGVLCTRDWEQGSEYWNGYFDGEYNSIPVRWLDLNWKKAPDPNAYLYKNPIIADYLDKYLSEYKPDIVHVTSCETLSASVIESVKRTKLPLVLSLTDFWFLCPTLNLLRSDGQNCSGVTTPWDCLRCTARRSKPYRWSSRLLPQKGVEILLTQISKLPKITRQRGFRGMISDMADRKQYMRYAFSLPDVRLVASKFVRDIHIQNGFDDSIQLHPYGHDLSWLDHDRDRKRSDIVTIGFIGQIIHTKGVHILLEAARQIKDKIGGKVKFLLYGNLHKHPGYASLIEGLAEGLMNIQFCGTYPREMSADVYSKMDILVVPSLWYDFPLIIHEAFATKTPVIATNLGGMAETVTHEVNGLLFERGNVDDLARQIRRLVDEPGLLAKLKKGIPRVKSVLEDVNELESMYRELTQRQKNPQFKEQ